MTPHEFQIYFRIKKPKYRANIFALNRFYDLIINQFERHREKLKILSIRRIPTAEIIKTINHHTTNTH